MGRLSRFSPQILACLLVAGLFAACGNKNSTTTITSSITPSVFYSHVAALKNYSTLYNWGANFYGQLGNNDAVGMNSAYPIQPLGLPRVIGGSAGGTHTLAVATNGAAYAWGNNGYGQLGNATLNVSLFPVPVLAQYSTIPTTAALHPLTGIAAVAAGGFHSLALDKGGAIWAWGNNGNGQLGDTTTTTRQYAYRVLNGLGGSPLTGATKIAAGGSHSLAVVGASATAYAWGYNGYGQLGQPKTFGTYSTSRDVYYPVQVVKAVDGTLLTNVVDIAAGGSHSLFVTSDGYVWACGYNGVGQLGVGDNMDRNHGVVQVLLKGVSATPLSNIRQVAAGLDHSLALMNDGTVWAWGFNFSGQLGNGAALSQVGTWQWSPVQVMKDRTNALTNIVKIIAIGNSSYAVDSSHILWAWGDNTFGQLGLGNSTSQIYATQVGSGFDLFHP